MFRIFTNCPLHDMKMTHNMSQRGVNPSSKNINRFRPALTGLGRNNLLRHFFFKVKGLAYLAIQSALTSKGYYG